ncbi:MAG: transposase [Gammaproteobacteria bacterium]|jgi:putative transposase|nr:transposase [Gammaproteobacteria bacterium]
MIIISIYIGLFLGRLAACNSIAAELGLVAASREAMLLRSYPQKDIAMPRKPRMYIGDIPCHVVQRGNNHGACFFAARDYHLYLHFLQDACRRYRVDLHAYVLMTNHVHLLMTPQDSCGISRVMQSLGRRYVQHVNVKYRRSGTLWDGRHKSSVVDIDAYFLTCMRYIELNPVRANMVKHPADYLWSSFQTNTRSCTDSILTPHPVYLALGDDMALRHQTYRSLFDDQLDSQAIKAIREAIQFSLPVGTEDFKRRIKSSTGQALDCC